ncbi:hypothetical protein P7C71_g3913, partial [Lecanoromycetidae sp. Uapishka_2]
MSPTPITIVTGYLGSGKTTLILNLIPQLPKTYKLALLKNEFGDVAIDSELASSSAIGGVQELLNGCICCNLVGQLGDALDTLRKDVHPDRIIIETSGSAFPATLAMEVNRLGRESGNYILDGVIVVIDVENWKGYDDTSYTAKMQARYTDVMSDKGKVDKSVLLGLDSAFAKETDPLLHDHDDHEAGKHDHAEDHQSEVEVLSVTLSSEDYKTHGVNLDSLETFLLSAPKDEVYRIKAIVKASRPPANSAGDVEPAVVHQGQTTAKYILNWAFGRWTFTPMSSAISASCATSSNTSRSGSVVENPDSVSIDPLLRMTVILARGQANKWKKRIETQAHIEPEDSGTKGLLLIRQVI